jgi:hypothetical protein
LGISETQSACEALAYAALRFLQRIRRCDLPAAQLAAQDHVGFASYRTPVGGSFTPWNRRE